MSMPRRESRTPWITAAVLGLVLAGLIVVFFAVLLPYRRDHHPTRTHNGAPVPRVVASGHILGDLTTDERAAVTAAGTEAANVLSYTRKNFEADYARALAGSTGKLKSDISNPTRKAATKSVIEQGKFDLSAKVGHAALVGPTDKGDGYVVIVTVLGYQSTALDVPKPQNLEVTMVRGDDRWLASDIESEGVQ